MNKLNNIIDLSPLGLIQVSGPDAEKFLQGQLTCDVREANAQQSRLGAHCDNKGRIQATFRLFNYQAHYYLQMPKGLITALLASLKKYAVFSKVNLLDVSAQWYSFGISGPDSVALLNEAVSKTLPQVNDEIVCLDNLIITRLSSLATPRFSLLGSVAAIAAVKPILAKRCQSADFAYWDLLDIAAGIPTIWPETSGLLTPQHINYPAINGVSFNKGCYIGQEIVARMYHLGKLKQRMYQITFAGSQAVAPGVKVLTGDNQSTQECGLLIQAARTSTERWQGLAVIADQAAEQTLYVENLDHPILHRQDLPYTVE